MRQLEQQVAIRIIEALERFVANPSQGKLRKLNLTGWRLRVGDWRVRLRPDFSARVLVVTQVGHRREIYRD